MASDPPAFPGSPVGMSTLRWPYVGSEALPQLLGWPTASTSFPSCSYRTGSGEVWAWKALLIAGLVQGALVLLRIPLPGTQLGISASITQLVPLVAGLLLDARWLKT